MKAMSGTSLLRRTANEVKHYRTIRRILPIILTCLAIVIVLVYVTSVMYAKFGSFSISVNKYHQLQYGLSLAESKQFLKPTSRLNCRASEEITNIDGSTLEGIDFGAVDGVDSGENYLCYTFYCRNSGEEIISYQYSIDIVNMTMGVEKAVRVRLITSHNEENRTQVDYARAASVDEQTHEAIPEPGTVPFLSKNIIMTDSVNDVPPGDTMKFTVVIWLEGNDDDCVDAIIGGSMKVDMKFEVTAVSGELI